MDPNEAMKSLATSISNINELGSEVNSSGSSGRHKSALENLIKESEALASTAADLLEWYGKHGFRPGA